MKKIVALLLAVMMTLGCVPGLAETTKHERVYVVAAADGTVKSVTDNIRLENADGLDEIVDQTLLTAIQNVGGKEAFALDGETLTWQAQGKDIIYQGTSDKVPAILPVVTLTLDGEEVTADALKNKTGDVVLTVSYQTQEQLPALCVTVLPLPEKGVTDLTMKNAAVLSVMGFQVLVGWAVPGIEEELNLPASFTASFRADHADLSWMMTLTTADPIHAACKELDERIDLDFHTELDEIAALLTALQNDEPLPQTTGKTKDIAPKITELNSGLTQLNSGAKTLSEGIAKLVDGASSLKTGIAQVKSGAKDVSTGAQTLASGTAEAETGAAALDEGLAALAANSEALNGGAQALLAAALNSANEQLSGAGLPVSALTAENYAAVLDELMAQTAPTGEGYNSLSALKAQLDQVSAFVEGLKSYTDGVSQAADGAAQLHSGLTQLNGGAAALSDGAKTLSKGASDLSSGANTLQFGLIAVNAGAATLQTTGTQKLKDALMDAEKKAAEKLLPYVTDVLPRALRIYEETRDNAQNSGYDLRPEGMKAVTVYIIRTDLQ